MRPGTVRWARVALASRFKGLRGADPHACAAKPIPDMGDSGGYGMVASPTLYPGQTIHARFEADQANRLPVSGRVYIQAAGADDRLISIYGPVLTLTPGQAAEYDWMATAPEGCPICWVGLEISSEKRVDGAVYLDYLTWNGAPDVRFGRPAHNGTRWLKAWTCAGGVLTTHPDDTYRMIQNGGRGMMIQGTREWRDYTVEATLTANLARSMGIAARVQGLKRYYALELAEGVARLVRERYGTSVLASCPYDWSLYQPYRLTLTVTGDRLIASIDGTVLFDLADASDIRDGAMAIVLDEGRIGCDDVRVQPRLRLSPSDADGASTVSNLTAARHQSGRRDRSNLANRSP